MSLVQYDDSSGSDGETKNDSNTSVITLENVDPDINNPTTSNQQTTSVTNLKEGSYPNTHPTRQVEETESSANTDLMTNYFFNNDSDNDDEIEESRSKKMRLIEKYSFKNSGDSGEFSGLPESPFWRTQSHATDWSETASIWGCVEDNTTNSTFNNSQISTDRKDNGSIPSRLPHTEKPTSLSYRSLEKTCYFVHHKVKPYLFTKTHNTLPKGSISHLVGHGGAVNRIQWCCPQYSHLLLSVSMDSTVKIWNVFSTTSHCVQVLSSHEKAVKDCRWTSTGSHVLTCGFDRTARHFDVEKGIELHCYRHGDLLSCMDLHPVNPNYFIVGGMNSLHLWDIRCSEAARRKYSYKDGSFGQVLDVIFSPDGNNFFTSNNIVCRDSADRNLMAWDFTSGVVLSNQIYQERYTCTRLCMHPHEGTFMAQTNGDYIAIFSRISPYKIHKGKRFEGHKVAGYNVGFDISQDGSTVVSGGSDGQLTFYNYRSGKLIRQIKEGGNHVLLDVAYHPVLPSTVATSTWAGDIFVYS